MAVLIWTYKYLKHLRAGKVLTKKNLTQKFILSTTSFVVVMLKRVLKEIRFFTMPMRMVFGRYTLYIK